MTKVTIHMIGSWSCQLSIFSPDQELSSTVHALCWERTVSVLSAQKHQLPNNAYMKCVGINTHPFATTHMCWAVVKWFCGFINK